MCCSIFWNAPRVCYTRGSCAIFYLTWYRELYYELVMIHAFYFCWARLPNIHWQWTSQRHSKINILLHRASISNLHYSDVIMSAMATEITSLTIVYATVYSGANKTHQSSAPLACEGNSPVTGEFPAQRVSNAENISIDDVIMKRLDFHTWLIIAFGFPWDGWWLRWGSGN